MAISPQDHYIKELPTMNIESRIDGNQSTNPTDIRSTFHQAAGALIWAHQTRPDIGFTIAQISTSIVESAESAEKAREIRRTYNKIAKFMKNHPRGIRYTGINQISGAESITSMLS